MRSTRLIAIAAALGCAACAPAGARASDRGDLEKIFEDWYLSYGGLGSPGPSHSYATRETLEIQAGTGAAARKRVVRMGTLRTSTGQFRFEISGPGISPSVQAWDGRMGWQSQADGGIGLLDNASSDVWAIQGDLLFALKAFRPPTKYRAAGPEKVDGHDCIAAAVTDSIGIKGKCWFDRKTLRLVRIERALGAGSKAAIDEDYDDYRPVGALQVPFTVRVTLGDTVTVIHRESVELDPPVDVSVFILSTAQYQEAAELRDVVRRYDATIGGAAAFAKIKSRVTRLSLEVSSAGTTSQQTISQKRPNLILVETDTPGMGKEYRGYDGRTGWLYSELQGYRPLKPAELAELLNSGGIHLVGPLEAALPFRRRVGERMVGGRPALAVALAGGQGPAGTFYFDKENGRLLRIGSTVSGDRENSTESTVDFGDFRKVDGIDIPFIVIQTNPLVRAVSTVKAVENNPVLADEMFRPRRDD